MKRLIYALLLITIVVSGCGSVTPIETPTAVPAVPSATQPITATVDVSTSTMVPSAPPVTISPTASATANPPTATIQSPTATIEQPSATTTVTANPPTATIEQPSATTTVTANPPTATIEQPSATTTVTANPPTATPETQAGLIGTIAFERDGGIVALRPQTSDTRVLIESGRDPQFSRDGTQIAFVRDDGLYIAQADGSDARRIVDQMKLADPRWNDDGSRLLFERRIDPPRGDRSEIWAIELASGAAQRIAIGNDPAWAPDGKRIAYVTPIGDLTATPRRNQLRLVNWRGENDWGVVRDLPNGVPPIGIPGAQVGPSGLEHLIQSPLWDAAGRRIYAPAFVLYQVASDFFILEQADPINGGARFLLEAPLGAGIGAPDRGAAVFEVGTARGDIGLRAYTLSDVPTAIEWASSDDVAIYAAATWSPGSDALAAFRCPLEQPTPCALVAFQAGQNDPAVLIDDVFGGQGLDLSAPPSMTWSRNP